MKDSEILQSAADVVLNGFTRDAYARDEKALPVSPHHPDAKCFCLVGAVMRVTGFGSTQTCELVNRWVTPLLPKRKVHDREFPANPMAWSDDPIRGQKEVAAALVAGATEAASKGA